MCQKTAKMKTIMKEFSYTHETLSLTTVDHKKQRKICATDHKPWVVKTSQTVGEFFIALSSMT